MANVIAQRKKGNLVYFDRSDHLRRVVDAVGPDVIKYDLLPWIAQVKGGTGTDPRGWTVTMVEAGAGSSEVEASDSAGKVIELLTDAAENDGINMQLIGESFELTADQELYFGIQLQINDELQTDFFAGLAIVDTDILGGVTDRIGFEKVDGSASIDFMVEKDSTQTTSSAVGTLAAATDIELEFYWSGAENALFVFVDGAQVTAPALTNLPNDEALRLSLQFLTGEAAANRMIITYCRCIQVGR